MTNITTIKKWINPKSELKNPRMTKNSMISKQIILLNKATLDMDLK